jgi:hypothetical protein
MTQRFWRDLVASNDHGMWQGAIPQPPTSPQGVEENFFSDVVLGLAKAEEKKERLGELLADAVHEGRVRLELAAPDEGKPLKHSRTGKRPGRPPKEEDHREMLREIRTANPESDGWAKFKKRLAGQLSPRVARR